MFRRTDSIVVRAEDGGEHIIEEHTYFQDETPGMKQYRTRTGASARRLSDSEFEIAGPAGAVRATSAKKV